MWKKLVLVLLTLNLLSIAGCVSVPRHEELSAVIEVQELSEHVRFLSQPGLKGRRPRSWESATVREYLKSRFECYGLVPWPGFKTYEQPFGFGTNVIGVLPGSDPNLADEIVIVAAHYDHLGKDKKGIYHGACDNASGVAVLLEIAEKLSLGKQPKRPVCFASFDCEEMWMLGAFVFTCREDFDESKIAAVVNIDLLGRDLLDVVDDALFVSGTEEYPQLRKKVLGAGDKAGLRVFVMGTDLVGPRGDHIAFESMGKPCLFFTSGVYRDYHKPTDTADKLNYGNIQHSAEVIVEAVRNLADSEKIEEQRPVDNAYVVELRMLRTVLQEIIAGYEIAGLSVEQAEGLKKLEERMDEHLKTGGYSSLARHELVVDFATVVLPYMLPGSEEGLDDAESEDDKRMRDIWGIFQTFYICHRDLVVEEYKELVKHILKHRPGLFRRLPRLERIRYELSDDEISFVEKSGGRYRLSALPSMIAVIAETKGWFSEHRSFSFEFGWRPKDFEGSIGQIIDACLLAWRHVPRGKSSGNVWRKMLMTATGQDYGQDYEAWLNWRLAQGGWSSEEQWLLGLIESENQQLVSESLCVVREVAAKQAGEAIYKVIKDESIRPDVRAKAIEKLQRDTDKKVLLTLVDMLTDNTECYKKEYRSELGTDYPFHGHIAIRYWETIFEEQFLKDAETPKTLGDKAEAKLKELTGKDFGADSEVWKKWIEANVK